MHVVWKETIGLQVYRERTALIAWNANRFELPIRTPAEIAALEV